MKYSLHYVAYAIFWIYTIISRFSYYTLLIGYKIFLMLYRISIFVMKTFEYNIYHAKTIQLYVNLKDLKNTSKAQYSSLASFFSSRQTEACRNITLWNFQVRHYGLAFWGIYWLRLSYK